jgi:ankyrin repeat protein
MYDGVCNAQNDDLETPLIVAARLGADTVAMRLLMHGANQYRPTRCEVVDVMVQDRRGRTALHWAADKGHAITTSSVMTIIPRLPNQSWSEIRGVDHFMYAPLVALK